MSKVDWKKIPDLNIQHYNRSYIDYIKEEQVAHSVMKGTDDAKRNFVVVKLDIEGEKIFETFFQRYDRGTYPGVHVWESKRLLFDTAIRKTQFDFIEKIINGEEVVCPDNSGYDPIGIHEKFIGKKIKLYK